MAVRPWQIRPHRKNTLIATVVLDGGDTSQDINLHDFPDKTVHIFGTFGDSTVSLLGLNDDDQNATGQNLHRTDDPAATLSGVSAEVMAHIIENPYILRASATGATGSDITVVIVGAATH